MIHRTLLVAGLISAVMAAQAITFSNVTINGNPTANWGLIGSSGIFVQVPNHTVVGIGFKSVLIGYTVSASTGKVLNTVRLEPNGLTNANGVVDVQAAHSGSSLVQLTSTSAVLSMLGTKTQNLVPTVASSNVQAKVDVTGVQSDSIAKMSVYNAFYTEVVPEPSAVVAIAAGLGALILRRKGGK